MREADVGAGADLWDQFATMLQKMDADGFASLFAGDAVYIDPRGRHEGREGIRAWIAGGAGALSDVHFETGRVIEHGSIIVAEWTWRSTHTGPLPRDDGSVIPATGKVIDVPGVTILDVRDQQIVAARDYFDQAVIASQLGLMPGA
jgi:steroid delta-isomerase-like uncharacterized protein